MQDISYKTLKPLILAFKLAVIINKIAKITTSFLAYI